MIDAYTQVSAYEFITGRRPKRKSLWRKKAKQTTQSSEYNEYIHSPQWYAFRQSIFAARGRMCQKCMSTTAKLELHHKHYRTFKHEQPEDVVILCRGCHYAVHAYWKRKKK